MSMLDLLALSEQFRLLQLEYQNQAQLLRECCAAVKAAEKKEARRAQRRAINKGDDVRRRDGQDVI